MLVFWKLCLILLLILKTVVFPNTSGLKIKSVYLNGKQQYVKASSIAHLKFDLSLESNETVQSIKWSKAGGSGHYMWARKGVPKAFGVLRGAVKLSTMNGDMIFPSVKLEHAGNYMLAVTTNLANDTANYDLIVHYLAGYSKSYNILSNNTSPCRMQINVRMEQVAPYPNVTCEFVVLSTTNKSKWRVRLTDFTHKLNENVTNFDNGTYFYSMNPEFEVQEFLMEPTLICTIWMEDIKISLPFTEFLSGNGPLCPQPVMSNLTYKVITGEKPCFHKYTKLTKISYSCFDNSNLSPQKSMVCIDGEWKWIDDTPWPTCEHRITSSCTSYRRVKMEVLILQFLIITITAKLIIQ